MNVESFICYSPTLCVHVELELFKNTTQDPGDVSTPRMFYFSKRQVLCFGTQANALLRCVLAASVCACFSHGWSL